MSTKKKVFLAMPEVRESNSYGRHEADLLKASYSRKGHEVVNPYDNNPGKDADEIDRAADHLRIALHCDLVHFAPGWGIDFASSAIMFAVREYNRTHPGRHIDVAYG